MQPHCLAPLPMRRTSPPWSTQRQHKASSPREAAFGSPSSFLEHPMPLPITKITTPISDLPPQANVKPTPKPAATKPPPRRTSVSAMPAGKTAANATDVTIAGPSTGAAPRSGKPVAGDAHVPGTWDAVKPGSLVLATTGPMEGWFESLIVATRADNHFLLRWRDWPDESEFTRRGDQLALLHPATDPQG